MYSNVTFSDFCDTFRDMDRDTNFSYDGKRFLFDYLEEFEADTGEQIEFDVISLCCDYSEASYDEIIADYSIDIDADMEEEEKREFVVEYLNDHTQICGYDDAVIVYANF